METLKKKSIEAVVDIAITAFAEGLISRYTAEVDNADGVINMKKNNCFIAELGEEFMFYSAFVRRFDSSFGNVLEKMGNKIAQLSYEVRGNISSFILPEQTSRIANGLDKYVNHAPKQKTENSSILLKASSDFDDKKSREYWNFVCNDEDGFDIVYNQYKKSVKKIAERVYKKGQFVA